MTNSPGESYRDLIARAGRAFGHPHDGDQELDFEAHCAAMCAGDAVPEDTAALRAVLAETATSEWFKVRCADYRFHDAIAARAKTFYHLSMKILILVGSGLLCLFFYLVLTPAELNREVRLLLCLIAGISAAMVGAMALGAVGAPAAAASVARALSRQFGTRRVLPDARTQPSSTGRKRGSRPMMAMAWISLALVGLVIGVVLALKLPEHFFVHREGLLIAIASMFLAVIAAADAMTGGIVARIVQATSPRELWYRHRARAEHIRRQYFNTILDKCESSQAASRQSEGEIPLPLQALMFVRRYHFVPQLRHYHQAAEARDWRLVIAELFQWLLPVSVVLLMILAALSKLASFSEQGGTWSWLEPVTAKLLSLMVAGYDDVALIIVLLLLGSAVTARLFSELERNRQDRGRYLDTHASLVGATSPTLIHIGRPDPASPAAHVHNDGSPLSSAELAAAMGEWTSARNVCRGFNIALAAEINRWSETMWKIIGQPGLPRLMAHERISGTDFTEIAHALEAHGVRPIRARKVGYIAVTPAKQKEAVVTRYYGIETRNEAEPGDWIVVNMDKDFRYFEGNGSADAHLVQDDEGHLDRYVIKRADVKANYRPTKHTTSQGVVYEAITADAPVDALRLAAGFDIVAPWGARQIRPTGVIVRRSNGEVYGIYDRAFDKTYERVA